MPSDRGFLSFFQRHNVSDNKQNPWLAKQQKKLDEAGPFFSTWIQELGITAENNTVVLTDPDRDAIGNQSFSQTIFQEDKFGNVIINYWNLNGETVNFWKENTSKNSYTDKYEHWKQTRLREPQPGKGKYLMPKGQGTLPFIPWPVVEKFRKGETIKTLYLTEGAKKAFLAAQHGADVVGLPSITCYKESDGELYRDVRRIIESCKVTKVVILWDADCRDISRHDLAEGEELTRRPLDFFKNAKKLRSLIKGIEFSKTRSAPRVFFMHPKKEVELEGSPKGLDDVLVAAKAVDKLEAVLADLKDLDRDKGVFFYRSEISSTTARLYRYFNLDEKNVEGFYFFHAEVIGGRSFMFHKNIYTYVEATSKLEMTQPGWAEELIAVGDDFFIELEAPASKKNFKRKKLYPRKKETLGRRYGKDFHHFINYFQAFTNIPDHFNHQQIIDVGGHYFYNRYHPFTYVPEPGNCEVTLDFVKHIFGTAMAIHPVTGQEIPRFELGLDYIKLLLEKPTQVLPVLILYSPENSTGKSTFFKLLARIFKNNAIFVGNSDLQSDFNAVYADKLLVMCEETLLERQKDTERIKAMSTASEITINEKNVSQYTVDFFAKFAFASNKSRMIYVSAQDERFWINRVPRATKENPHLLEEMIKEIPAFVDYLIKREMVAQDESRMWFHPGLIKTETLAKTVAINEPGEVSNIREKMVNLFEANEGEEEILLPMKNIRMELFKGNNSASQKWIKELLRDYLDVQQLRNDDGTLTTMRGSYKRLEHQYEGNDEVVEKEVTVEFRGCPYVFKRSVFMLDHEPA